MTVENPVAADPQRFQQVLNRCYKNTETILDAAEEGYRGTVAIVARGTTDLAHAEPEI